MGTIVKCVEMVQPTWGMTWLWVALSVRAGAHVRVPTADRLALKRRSGHRLRHLVHAQQVKRGSESGSRTKRRTHMGIRSPRHMASLNQLAFPSRTGVFFQPGNSRNQRRRKSNAR